MPTRFAGKEYRARRCFSIGCVFLLLAANGVVADDYGNARRDLVAAYQQGDYRQMRVAARSAIAARPGYPGALFNLALAQALDDDPVASLQTLRDLLSMGVDFGVRDLDEFSALKDLLEWRDYEAAAERLYEPAGFAEVVATLDVNNFIPEGIAGDSDGRLYLGSIRSGDLVRLDDEPHILSSADDGHWSVFGMRFDDSGALWFASSAVPQFADAGADLGQSGLFRYDPERGTISQTALLPASAEIQVLGDLVIAGDGAIYSTDSATGVLYRFEPDAARFETVVDRGVFGSPQGLVLDATGQFLYLADYIGGLYRVTLASGAVDRLRVEANLTDYGIDGLYRHGEELIAIQNGIRPQRVVALRLGGQGLSIVAGRILASNLEEFDEPALGFVAGDDFFFVANSHWNRFDAQNGLPEGLTGPIVLRLSLHPE